MGEREIFGWNNWGIKGVNLFVYVTNNSIKYTDPEGKQRIAAKTVRIRGAKVTAQNQITSARIKRIHRRMLTEFRKHIKRNPATCSSQYKSSKCSRLMQNKPTNIPYHKTYFNCLHFVINYVLALKTGKVYYPGIEAKKRFANINKKEIYNVLTGGFTPRQVFPRPGRRGAKGLRDRIRYYRAGQLGTGSKAGWYVERGIPGQAYRVVKTASGALLRLQTGDIIYTAEGETGRSFDLKHKLFVVIKGDTIELWGIYNFYNPEETNVSRTAGKRQILLLKLNKSSSAYYKRRIITNVVRPVY